ncbi:Hypothetical predicted protein, partial [Mytilus galloprovincialis]
MERLEYSTIVAFDFGTTYSGYAYSFKSNLTKNSLNIHVNKSWNSGNRQFLTLKTPTCILLDINTELQSFGYEAETEYAYKCIDGAQNDSYFFRGFNIKQ